MTTEPGLEELYKDIILDHYRRPRNHGPLVEADVSAEGVNPVCGDEIHVQAALTAARVDRVQFWGKGCSISQASASLMTVAVAGKNTADAERISQQFEAMLTAGAAPAEELGDLEALQGVAKFHVRVKCALLAWKVLQQALAGQGEQTPVRVSTE